MNKPFNLEYCCRCLLAILYVVLPTYFSFEISDVFPSLTASRLVILICTIYLFYKKKIRLPNKQLLNLIISCLGILVIVNSLHFFDCFTYSIKQIFSLIFENSLLILIMVSLIQSERDVYTFLEYMVIASSVVAVIAIIEFFSGFNMFYLLTTTAREAFQAGFTRLGMTRAEASFSHPVYYAVYCTCMLPFCMHLYEKSRNYKWLLSLGLNVMGVIASGSRGQYLITGIILICMFLSSKKEKRDRYIKYLKPIVIVSFTLIMIITPVREYFFNMLFSILNSFGFNFSIDSNFGMNLDGIYSRFFQLSGFVWVIKNGKLLIGYGPDAAFRGLVSYFWKSPNYTGWVVTKTVDIGYVGWFLDYGVLGFLAMTYMIIKLFSRILKREKEDKQTDSLFNSFKWFIIVYLLNLTVSIGVEKLFWLVLGLYISYESIYKIKETSK